ncbi:MAG: LapA family protein [Leptolyngbyaceae cyanobacterium RU_5_1]|nr:LapA family protein [Leptolyngbyaceae cyanobacterium RU_5_1]
MRQVNFAVIFVICLALVLFGIQNTESVPIQIVKGVQLQAPLSIELILAMGIGAILAWVFSVWTRVQRMVEVGKDLRDRDSRIHELEEDVERYKAEIDQQRLLPAAKPVTEDTEAEFVTQ